MNIKLWVGSGLALALSACGGGGTNSPGNTSESRTGQFIDSAVEGLYYVTATHSGTTNTDGEFTYVPGESITFSIGNLVFPTIEAEAIITPVTLSPSNSIQDNAAINIARLLQSLDEDNNPNNGIRIPQAASTVATQVDFSVSPEMFSANTDIVNLIANSGSINTELITSEVALNHLSATLAPGFPDGIWRSTGVQNPPNPDVANEDVYLEIRGNTITAYGSSTDENSGQRCWDTADFSTNGEGYLVKPHRIDFGTDEYGNREIFDVIRVQFASGNYSEVLRVHVTEHRPTDAGLIEFDPSILDPDDPNDGIIEHTEFYNYLGPTLDSEGARAWNIHSSGCFDQ